MPTYPAPACVIGYTWVRPSPRRELRLSGRSSDSYLGYSLKIGSEIIIQGSSEENVDNSPGRSIASCASIAPYSVLPCQRIEGPPHQ